MPNRETFFRVSLGFLVSGCQANIPVKTKAQTDADFRRDAATIEQFGNAHPWSGSDEIEDIPQALSRIEAIKAKGAAYIDAEDLKCTRKQQALLQERDTVQKKKQAVIDAYESAEAAKVSKRPMGSFGLAYYKLLGQNRFQPYFDEEALKKSGIRLGVYQLDIPFAVVTCNRTLCVASSDTFAVQPAVTILTPRTPALRPGIRLPYALVDIMGTNDIGVLVVRLLAPMMSVPR
ncbi:hypothetical protein [Pseudomonas syringae]|uniref:Uncharacterized protein n=1 Tax=Pseudomonas syringae pv. papulans TaxID=83963 RepID=A0AA43E0Z5_PSESX|nr:hypothetical protein [Pseudomonas syringae]KWS36578.1 hypothetical protein AL059_04800 [Pseudomonas syringae pv. papulans]MDH4606823.1 hypothetical protein [Pseudomonas syringae pv. papulans]MDH4625792.1 hypothetical protein [Pseudomonas syringae pv. papulans]